MTTLAEQLAEQQRKIADWQRQQQQRIQQQAEEARRDVREQVSDVEKSAQETLQKTQKEKQKAKTLKAIRKPFDIRRTKEVAKEVEKAHKETVKKGKKAQEAIVKAEKETEVEIEKVSKEALAELKASYDELVANNTELQSGELIPNETFNALSKEDQNLLIEIGTEKYNKVKEEEAIAEFKDQHIKIGNKKKEEWITREYYDKQTPEDQDYITSHTLKEWNKVLSERAYNDYKDMMEAAGKPPISLESWLKFDPETQAELIGASLDEYYVTLGDTGDILPKGVYDALSSEDQQLIADIGIEEFNLQKDNELYEQYVDVAKEANIGIKSKADWNNLSSDAKLTLVNETINQANELSQEDLEKNNHQINDGTWIPLESYTDEDGKQITGWNDLTKEQQDLINEWGIEKAQEIMQQEWETFKDENKQLPNFPDDWVNKNWFNSLSTTEKTILLERGIAGYQKWLDDNFVEITGGEGGYIHKTDPAWTSLSTADKNLLVILGAEQFNITKQAEFERDNIELDNGDWMPKETTKDKDGNELPGYNDFDKEDKALLMSLGLKGFQDTKQKEVDDYIASQPPEARAWIAEYGLEDFNKWLDKAEKETDGHKKLTIYIGLGLVEKGSTFAGYNEKGEMQILPPTKPIDLNNVNVNELTADDYPAIMTALANSNYYKIMPGVVGGSIAFNAKNAFNEWIKQFNKSEQEHLKNIYAQGNIDAIADVLSFVFPPARALRADTTLSQISGTDWAIGIAQLGLLVVAPALGIVGKAGSIISRIAIGTRTAIQTAAIIAFPVITAIEWDKMSPTQRIISATLNAAILLPSALAITRGIIAKLDPKTTIAKNLAKAELKIAKDFKGNIEKAYGKVTADSYMAMVKAEVKYIQSLQKATKLKVKTTPAMKAIGKKIVIAEKKLSTALKEQNWIVARQARTDITKLTERMTKISPAAKAVTKTIISEQKLVNTARKFVDDIKAAGKGYDTPTMLKSLDDLPADIVRNVKSAIKEINKAGNIKQIKSAIKKTTKALKRIDVKIKTAEKVVTNAYNKYNIAKTRSNRINLNNARDAVAKLSEKKATLQAELLLYEHKLKEILAEEISQLFSSWQLAKEKLTTLKLEKLKIEKGTTKEIALTNQIKKLEKQTVKLKNKLQTMLKEADITWAEAQDFITGGKGGAAVKAKPVRPSSTLAQEMKIKGLVEPTTGLSTGAGTAAASTAATIALTSAISKQSILPTRDISEFPKPKTRTTVPKTVPVGKPFVGTDITTKTTTEVIKEAQEQIQQLTKELTNTKTQEAIQKAADTAIQNAVEAQTQGMTSSQIASLIEPVLQPAILTVPQSALQTKLETKITTVIKTMLSRITPPRTKGTIRIPIKLPVLDEEETELTKAQKKGAVGWKQGFIYIYIYPPYGEKQVLYSRTPIKGIRLYKGAKSAYESIIKIGKGKLPAKIQRDMGIMDITITTKGKKPTIHFKRDIKQKTRLTPRIKVSR